MRHGFRYMGFNSRSREGSDALHSTAPKILGVSIHAPARGATYLRVSTELHEVFQFTLPRGERLL